MKKIAAVLVLLGTTSAFACPNLAGTYSCAGENGAMVDTTITQAEANGVTTYVLTEPAGSQQFIADGLTRTGAGKVQSGNDAVINVTNSCNADISLVMDATYAEKDATGKEVMSAVIQQIIALDSAGALMVSGTYAENGSAAQPFSSTCAKK